MIPLKTKTSPSSHIVNYTVDLNYEILCCFSSSEITSFYSAGTFSTAIWFQRSRLTVPKGKGAWKWGRKEEYSETFQGIHEVKTIVIIIPRHYLPFSLCWYLCWWYKTVSKTAGSLAQTKAAALNCSLSHILHIHVLSIKKIIIINSEPPPRKKVNSYLNVLDEARKLLILLNL